MGYRLTIKKMGSNCSTNVQNHTQYTNPHRHRLPPSEDQLHPSRLSSNTHGRPSALTIAENNLVAPSNDGWLLHSACSMGRVNQALHLLAQRPQAARVLMTITQQTPLSLVCARRTENHESLELIKALVTSYPQANMICDYRGRLPIDHYFQQQQRLHKDAIKLLVPDADWASDISDYVAQPPSAPLRQRSLTADDRGYIPLHKACKEDYHGLAFYLLHRFPEAAMIPTVREKRTALSLACDRPGVEPELIQWLVSIYPEALTIACNGMFPLHYACKHGADLKILRCLVNDNVCRKIKQSGIELAINYVIDHQRASLESIAFLIDVSLMLEVGDTNPRSFVPVCEACEEVPENSNMMPEESVRECCICLEPLDSNVSRLTSCGHGFHTHCIQQQMFNAHANCPLCRAHISPSALTLIR